MAKHILVYGASQGLGQALVKEIPAEGDVVFGVSRKAPLVDHGMHWIEADLSSPEDSVAAVHHVIGQQKLDVLIYNVGIWESLAFQDHYDFEEVSDAEILNMVQVNIASCLLHLKAALPNLRQSQNGKIILIGSTWGLENHQGKEVVFSACKFAIRGMVHALRESLRDDQIGISVLNLGYLATEFGIDVPVADVLAQSDESLIPLADVVAAIRFILGTSRASCVKEINMPAMLDVNA